MNVRLKKDEEIKVLYSDDTFAIMQRILLRENKIDRNREHFWTISLDNAYKILNIELVSMGSNKKTIVEPTEVLSIPLQKQASTIILVHNHPSGELEPSDADKDTTDRLIQCGLIMKVPVLDHVIISEKDYYSFSDEGLLDELKKSTKYVPPYKIKEQLEKRAEEIRKSEREQKTLEIAKAMKQNGVDVELIMQCTGLSKEIILDIRIK